MSRKSLQRALAIAGGVLALLVAGAACSKKAALSDRTGQRQVQAISRAVFVEGRLWLLQDVGSLASLRPDDGNVHTEQVPDKVLDICKSGGALAGLFEDGKAQWKLQRRTAQGWTTQVPVPTEGDTLIALGCKDASSDIILVTDRRLVELTGTRSRSVPLKQPLREPIGIGTAFVTDDAVWLGLNAGEWGGGLRRIALKNGIATSIVKNNSGDPCRGTLNIVCDPVNGIVSSPWKPGCLVAAVGMVHFMSHGDIVEVCGNEVRRLYFKALDPQPPYGKSDDGEPASTIAFFGLARTGNTVWGIGIDGLYRFDGSREPQFHPLPKFENRGSYRVSFEIPGVALVLTDVNQRRSMSGSVPIMAVR